MRHGRLAVTTLALILLPATAASAAITDAPVRDAEAVVLKGRSFAGWAVPANQTVKLPLTDLACYEVKPGEVGNPTEDGADALTNSLDGSNCPHSHYAQPEVDTAGHQPAGTPIDQLTGFAWDAKQKRFEPIPFQVDEVFVRYLDNSASGFAPYSGEDQHETYAYDREGFRFTKDGPAKNPCLAQPDSPVAKDPVAGLDFNDEVAFMARDGGPQAPSDAAKPKGVAEMQEVVVTDPANAKVLGYVYAAKLDAKAPKSVRRRDKADDGYVSYERDKDADLFEKSESSYENYGNAPKGLYCDKDGNVVLDPKTGKPDIAQRRPRDGATITTPRYRYRYDGRWLMTQIRISPDGGKSYGPDLVDRWKARAFAQDPGSETPCCGYEEEDTNWGGSSILLGEKVGPVRAIRETWGADSGTNVIRRETFYRDQMVQRTWLRVHVIPPLDGIYAQWDFNAGRMTRYSNPTTQDVKVDGRNDEVFGNFDDPCSPKYDDNDTGDLSQGYRSLYEQLQFCRFPYHLSMDMTDPTFNAANAALQWSQTSGPYGTIVDRIQSVPEHVSPGGSAQSVAAVPYYRDDACFDDGTGSDPGVELYPRHPDQEAKSTAPDGTARQCWRGTPAVPGGDAKYWQGSIGTHGLHLLFLADSDNARQTVPLTEIVSDWNMVMLPGDPGDVGDQYGRSFEKPLVAVARPM